MPAAGLLLERTRSQQIRQWSEGYLGGSDTFDRPVADFAVAYADQNEAGHGVSLEAIRNRRIEVYQEQYVMQPLPLFSQRDGLNISIQRLSK
jgi:hypothetical protein